MMKHPHIFPRRNSLPTERTTLLPPPPPPTPLTLSLLTPPRLPSPINPQKLLFTRYEHTAYLANTLLAAMQEVFYRVVPYPFDKQLLRSIHKFKPLLLEAVKRFKEIELMYRKAMELNVEIGRGGGFEMSMERGVDELEELLGRAKGVFGGGWGM